MGPSGRGSKKIINEITRLINLWTEDSHLENIALKEIYVMPALLLQKQNKDSKAKDHAVALEKKLELWENGNIVESIQERSPTDETSKEIAKIYVEFKELM